MTALATEAAQFLYKKRFEVVDPSSLKSAEDLLVRIEQVINEFHRGVSQRLKMVWR